jgi:hypothetical protein
VRRGLWRFLLLTLVANPASALTQTYFFTGGHAIISAVRKDPVTGAVGATVVAETQVPLNGVFVTFDDVNIDIVDFSITIPQTGLLSMVPPGYDGFDQFVIESASLAPAPTFSTLFGQDLGGGQFSFLAGPVDIDGVYSASDSTNVKPAVSNLPAPFTDTSNINGSINIGTGQFSLIGVTLTTLPGTSFAGETDDLQVKGDIFFTGVVPEPGTGALLGLGLVGLAGWRRSTRRRIT